jgi:nucleotide-binding universal stress UspA family protein
MGRIVVGVDGSDRSKEALRWAGDQARLTGSTLHLVSAWDRSIPPKLVVPQPEPSGPAETLRHGLKDLVTDVLGASPDVEVRVDVVNSHPGPALVDVAMGADLLVVGSRGYGTIARILHLGSVSLHCATHAPCPVAVHRDRSADVSSVEAPATSNGIVAAIDGSETSIGAALWAARQAGLTASTLEIVIAWHWPAFSGLAPASPDNEYDPEEDARGILDEAVLGVRAAYPAVEVRGTIINGPPARTVVQAADAANLLVVGSRGHGEVVGKLLGSVSEHCVTNASCSVLVFRG